MKTQTKKGDYRNCYAVGDIIYFNRKPWIVDGVTYDVSKDTTRVSYKLNYLKP